MPSRDYFILETGVYILYYIMGVYLWIPFMRFLSVEGEGSCNGSCVSVYLVFFLYFPFDGNGNKAWNLNVNVVFLQAVSYVILTCTGGIACSFPGVSNVLFIFNRFTRC